jgi:hypothetical protein
MAIDGGDLLKPAGEIATSVVADIARARVPAARSGAIVAGGAAYAATQAVSTWTIVTDTDADLAARAWAYAALYGERRDQLLTAAASLSADGEGSRSYSTQQAIEFGKLADRWKAVFDGYAATEAAGLTTFVAPRTSRTVPNTFTW